MWNPSPPYKDIAEKLEKICNDYQSNRPFSRKLTMVNNTHHVAAETIKNCLRDLKLASNAEKPNEAKLVVVQYLIAELLDYLTEHNSKKLMDMLNQLCIQHPTELSTEALNRVRAGYPSGYLKDHLSQTSQTKSASDVWTKNGGISIIFNAYAEPSPTRRRMITNNAR